MQDNTGCSPLYAAALMGQLVGAKALLRRNAKVKVTADIMPGEKPISLKEFSERVVSGRLKLKNHAQTLKIAKLILRAVNEGKR